MANTGNNRFQSYLPGISNVGSYQVSGKPYITGSADIDNDVQHKISFPQVAKSVTVINKRQKQKFLVACITSPLQKIETRSHLTLSVRKSILRHRGITELMSL